FFGSFDAANFITVDKPPLGTMLMGLSVRIFGLSSWSILLPEALAGVATVALLFVLVRHSFGPVAAVIAGAAMALTPAAVLIFRYNNPDALLTLLLVLGAGALLKALEAGRLRWVILAATFVGLAFNTKYLQAYLLLPAFATTFAIAAAASLRRTPAGLLRGRAPRTDVRRAGYLLWGLWLATHLIVFSFMSGIIHSYYAVAMAPAIAALVGAGAVELWALRGRARFGGVVLGGTIALTAV